MMMVLSLAPSVAEEPIEIIVGVEALASAGWPASLEEDPIYQKILEATGVSWKITLVDDYWNGMSSRILNENIPDVFFIDAAHQDEYANGCSPLKTRLSPISTGPGARCPMPRSFPSEGANLCRQEQAYADASKAI